MEQCYERLGLKCMWIPGDLSAVRVFALDSSAPCKRVVLLISPRARLVRPPPWFEAPLAKEACLWTTCIATEPTTTLYYNFHACDIFSSFSKSCIHRDLIEFLLFCM